MSLFSGPNCHQTREFGIKNLKKFPGVTPPDPLSGRGRPRPAPIPSTATRRARRRKLPRYWDIGLGNRSPKSKFTTTPLNTRSDSWRDAIDAIVGGYRRSRRTKGRATGRAMELHDRSCRRLHRVNTVLHTHTHTHTHTRLAALFPGLPG